MSKDLGETDKLLREIAALRLENEELRKKLSIDPMGEQEKRQHPRSELKAEIEFIADFDVRKAEGVDISNGGICFEHSSKLPFELLIRKEDSATNERAELVWVRRCPNGNYRFGFQFVDRKKDTDF